MTRLWFDKADGKTTYNVYPDQRFYSVEFTPSEDGELEQVQFLTEVCEQFSEWCKANYRFIQQGTGGIVLPPELMMVTNRMREADDGESATQQDTEDS